MVRRTLDFRIDLATLYKEFNSSKFDTLSAALVLLTEDSRDVSVKTKKYVSGKLDSLYRMRFLNRKREKRLVTTKTGRKCYRGYKYTYSVSEQGRKYLDYLDNFAQNHHQQPGNRLLPGNLIDQALISHLETRLPQPLKPTSGKFYRMLFPSEPQRPIERRFPLRIDSDVRSAVLKLIKENDNNIEERDNAIAQIDKFVKLAYELIEMVREERNAHG